MRKCACNMEHKGIACKVPLWVSLKICQKMVAFVYFSPMILRALVPTLASYKNGVEVE